MKFVVFPTFKNSTGEPSNPIILPLDNITEIVPLFGSSQLGNLRYRSMNPNYEIVVDEIIVELDFCKNLPKFIPIQSVSSDVYIIPVSSVIDVVQTSDDNCTLRYRMYTRYGFNGVESIIVKDTPVRIVNLLNSTK